MARRSGQVGYEEVKGGWYHVRFRMDVPGQERRAYLSKPICPSPAPVLSRNSNVSGRERKSSPQAERTATNTSSKWKRSITAKRFASKLNGG